MGERKTGGGLERRVVSKKPQLPLLLESPFGRFPMGSSCLSWALPRVSSTDTELLSARRGERAGSKTDHCFIPMAGPGGKPVFPGGANLKMDQHPAYIIPPSFFRLALSKVGRRVSMSSSWEPSPRSSPLYFYRQPFSS